MMLGIPLIFFVILFLKYREGVVLGDYAVLYDAFKVVVPFFCILTSGVAYLLYFQLLKKARKETTLRLKLQQLFNANIVKFALLEGATVFVLLAYFLTGHPLFAAFYVFMLILFGMSNPSIYSLMTDLKLPKKEADIMRENRIIE